MLGPYGSIWMTTSTTEFAPAAAASARRRSSAWWRIALYICEYSWTSPWAKVRSDPVMPRPSPSAYAILPITKRIGR